MQEVHVHLLLNHVPILGTLFGLILLIFGIFRKNESLIQAAQLTFVVCAVVAIPAFLSGEGAEEVVEKLGISHDVIHEHEEIAEKAIWISEFLGLVSLVALFFSFQKNPKRFALNWLVLGVAMVAFALMAYVGSTGGKIRHSELDSNPTTVSPSTEQDSD